MAEWLQGNGALENKIRRAGEFGRSKTAIGILLEIHPQRVTTTHLHMDG